MERGSQGSDARRSRCRIVVDRLTGGRRHVRLALIAIGALLLLAGVAIAGPTGDFITSSGPTGGIVKAGPVDPVNGFPAWYRDSKSVDLEGCVSALDVNCGAVPVPDPTSATVFPTNFPNEFFYMDATANMLTGSGDKVLAQFAVEGAFANGKPVTGDQMTFSRIRFRIDSGLQGNGQYTITHPYGVDVVQAGPDPTAKPNVFLTQDTGAAVGAFSLLTQGRVGPFLQWTPPTAADPKVPPAGYIGDAVTAHAVTGSTNGTNFVRIVGPGIGAGNNTFPCTTTGANAYTGAAADCIETNLFTLVGKLSTNGGVNVARASYSRDAAGKTTIDAFADSKAAQQIFVTPTSGTSFVETPMTEQDSRYFARVAVAGTMPTTVNVTNRGDIPQTIETVKVTDLVSAGTASYDTTTSTIHVQASSSDKSASPPTLSVPLFTTTLDATGVGNITGITAPPASVTIESSAGGSMTVPVEAAGATTAPLPLVAVATADQTTVNLGQTVNLSAASSTGNITGWTWSAPAAGVALTSFNTKTTSFVATAPGDFVIGLTVDGIAGSPPAPATSLPTSITIHVNDVVAAPTAKIAVVGPAVPQNWPVTLDATPSIGAATYKWEYVPAAGDPAITINPSTAKTATFTFPKTTGTLTFKLTVCNAATPAACNSTTIALRGQVDTLTVARARFTGGRWVVAGTASSTLSNNVTVHAGSTLAGRVIGTVNVDALGNYQLDSRNSGVLSNTVVSIESARGGVLLNQAVR